MIWLVVSLVHLCLVQFSFALPPLQFFYLLSPNASIRAPSSKIVGGVKVDVKNYPYQLSMQYNGRHICGASILSAKFALTAAHCTDKLTPSKVYLRAGTSRWQQGGQLVQVKAIRQHPKYNFDTVDYDVSVLEVAKSFTFNERVKSIVIASSTPREGTTVSVSGWGTTQEDSNQTPSELRAVQVIMIGKTKCQKSYSRYMVITDRMICAGYPRRGGKDSCQGDSGGPLVHARRLVGVVSWGFGCGRQTFPGVYTNLNNMEIRQFIKSYSGL